MNWILLVLVALSSTWASPVSSLTESTESDENHYPKNNSNSILDISSLSKSGNSLEDDRDMTSFAFVTIEMTNPDDAVFIHGSDLNSRRLECRLCSNSQTWASLYSNESGKLVAAMTGGASLYVRGMKGAQYFPPSAPRYDGQTLHPNFPFHEIFFDEDETLLIVVIIPHDPTMRVPLKVIHNIVNLAKHPPSLGAVLHLMQNGRRGHISVIVGYMMSSPIPSEDSTDLFTDLKIFKKGPATLPQPILPPPLDNNGSLGDSKACDPRYK